MCVCIIDSQLIISMRSKARSKVEFINYSAHVTAKFTYFIASQQHFAREISWQCTILYSVGTILHCMR